MAKKNIEHNFDTLATTAYRYVMMKEMLDASWIKKKYKKFLENPAVRWVKYTWHDTFSRDYFFIKQVSSFGGMTLGVAVSGLIGGPPGVIASGIIEAISQKFVKETERREVKETIQKWLEQYKDLDNLHLKREAEAREPLASITAAALYGLRRFVDHLRKALNTEVELLLIRNYGGDFKKAEKIGGKLEKMLAKGKSENIFELQEKLRALRVAGKKGLKMLKKRKRLIEEAAYRERFWGGEGMEELEDEIDRIDEELSRDFYQEIKEKGYLNASNKDVLLHAEMVAKLLHEIRKAREYILPTIYIFYQMLWVVSEITKSYSKMHLSNEGIGKNKPLTLEFIRFKLVEFFAFAFFGISHDTACGDLCFNKIKTDRWSYESIKKVIDPKGEIEQKLKKIESELKKDWSDMQKSVEHTQESLNKQNKFLDEFQKKYINISGDDRFRKAIFRKKEIEKLEKRIKNANRRITKIYDMLEKLFEKKDEVNLEVLLKLFKYLYRVCLVYEKGSVKEIIGKNGKKYTVTRYFDYLKDFPYQGVFLDIDNPNRLTRLGHRIRNYYTRKTKSEKFVGILEEAVSIGGVVFVLKYPGEVLGKTLIKIGSTICSLIKDKLGLGLGKYMVFSSTKQKDLIRKSMKVNAPKLQTLVDDAIKDFIEAFGCMVKLCKITGIAKKRQDLVTVSFKGDKLEEVKEGTSFYEAESDFFISEKIYNSIYSGKFNCEKLWYVAIMYGRMLKHIESLIQKAINFIEIFVPMFVHLIRISAIEREMIKELAVRTKTWQRKNRK